MTVNPISTNRIQWAIAQASSRTGIDFDYLLGQAKLESGLNANAKAGTSSASGLYQFIDSSWLSIVKKHGSDAGLGWAANAIQPGANGKLTVADGATRSAILALRNDPQVASLMAAEHAADNKTALESTLGRAATGTDLYMAHFLGLGGATKFLSAMQANPAASAASLFPAAAAANSGIFYNANGGTRSLSDIYQHFGDKLGSGAGNMLAAATGAGASSSATALMAQALSMGTSTVVTGNGESASDAIAWAQSTMGHLGGNAGNAGRAAASVFRPTPDTARLAYLMLARMGG
ncbi:lytic transglycosylase domain-containing protein [uncultured Sphingomonas sp.]|uniref:lytic transglycosylase domain-containing protein n=1 Tax=uncultured Sphingomonas sp. TaxID=158754 RepID=UPI0035CA3579